MPFCMHAVVGETASLSLDLVGTQKRTQTYCNESDPFCHWIILVLFEVLFPSTSNSTSKSTKTFLKNVIFEEVSVLFEVLFEALFLPAVIACDLTLPTQC